MSQNDYDTEINRDEERTTISVNERPLLKVRPSWWNYFWYLFFCWLIIPLIIGLWKRASFLLVVYHDRVILERGVLSKHTTQVLFTDIRSLDMKQSFMQRIVGIGNILIGTAGMAGYEIIAPGMPDPKGISNMIMARRKANRRSGD